MASPDKYDAFRDPIVARPAEKAPPPPIAVSREELEKVVSKRVDDPELVDWMAQRGIALDSGFVDVEIDGERRTINTSREDFGTVVDKEAAEKLTRLNGLQSRLKDLQQWERSWIDNDRRIAGQLESEIGNLKQELGQQ